MLELNPASMKCTHGAATKLFAGAATGGSEIVL